MQLKTIYMNDVVGRKKKKRGMIRFRSLTLMLLLTYTCVGQTVSSYQLLAGQIDSSLIQLLQDNRGFLENTNQDMPLVDKMEFRTETDELNIARQEYVFRVSFNGKKSREALKKVTQSQGRLYELKEQTLEEDQLEKRYELLIDWYYINEELKDLADKRVLLADKKTVFQKMLNISFEFNIEKLLKVEEDLQEIDRNVLQLNSKKRFTIRQLLPGQGLENKIELDSSRWISLPKMEKLLNEIILLDNSTIDQIIQEEKVNFAQLEYNVEDAEGKKILDFVQAKYAGREKIGLDKELSFGLGINIPTKGGTRVKKNEAMLDIFDEQYKAEVLAAELKEKTIESYNEFQVLIQEYQVIQDQISNNSLEETFKKYRSKGTVNPLSLLQIKESILKSKRALTKIEKDACLLFLEVLVLKGQLALPEKVNYLSDDLHSF